MQYDSALVENSENSESLHEVVENSENSEALQELQGFKKQMALEGAAEVSNCPRELSKRMIAEHTEIGVGFGCGPSFWNRREDIQKHGAARSRRLIVEQHDHAPLSTALGSRSQRS